MNSTNGLHGTFPFFWNYFDKYLESNKHGSGQGVSSYISLNGTYGTNGTNGENDTNSSV